MMLHLVCSIQKLGINRILVHANDTDVLVLCVYYTNKCRHIRRRLRIKHDSNAYNTVHDVVDRLGKAVCPFLPFFHALSGKNDTSFMYGIGKKMWDAQELVAHPDLDQFAEVIQDDPCQLTDV